MPTARLSRIAQTFCGELRLYITARSIFLGRSEALASRGETLMKNICLSVFVFALLVGGAATRAAARPAQSTDTTAPSYDMKPQSIQDFDDMHKKFVSLAQAIPADKFTWRPAPGVRSI